MGILQYELMLGIQKSIFNERLRRRPFLKIVEETKDYPVPLCYDPRTENEVMTHISMRMRRKIQNRYLKLNNYGM